MLRTVTRGIPHGIPAPVVGRITRDSAAAQRSDAIFVADHKVENWHDLLGYRGVVTALTTNSLPGAVAESPLPIVFSAASTDHLNGGDIAVMMPKSGMVRTIYRPGSPHNVLFLTERCNSRCLMCSQPPHQENDDWRIELNLELINLIATPPETLTITGGEPTLLGNGLYRVFRTLRERLPSTNVHMLTNARRCAAADFTSELAAVAPQRFSVGVPLYGTNAEDHNHVVNSVHAFEQTVLGLHQLARFGVRVEIRVVIHAATAAYLPDMAEYIYRNFPFAYHVAWMGLEPIGLAVANWDTVWIDPVDYVAPLHEAVEHLWLRGMDVSIFNVPLCLLRRSLWRFARKSISDWKTMYLPECEICSAKAACCGLFASARRRHSRHIAPLPPNRNQQA